MALFGPSKREQELQAEVERLRAMLSPRVIEGEALADCRIVGLVQQVIKAV